jgi:hypothetical protein
MEHLGRKTTILQQQYSYTIKTGSWPHNALARGGNNTQPFDNGMLGSISSATANCPNTTLLHSLEKSGPMPSLGHM